MLLLRKSKLECRIVAWYFPDFLLYRDSLIYVDDTGGFFALKDTRINNDLSGRFSKYFNVFNIHKGEKIAVHFSFFTTKETLNISQILDTR